MTEWDTTALRASPLVGTLEAHVELGSTSDRAKELSSSTPVLPALVLAERQTAGRGRGGNRWWASEGALTLSLLIKPAQHGLAVGRQGLISLATAVAVIDAVRRTTDLKAGYKWPNDVLLDGRKLAGVLLEAPRPDRLVVGVGINVENRFDEAPEEVQARATSLADTGVSRQQVLEAFLQAFHQRLAQLASGDAGPIDAARAACVLTGTEVAIRDGDRLLAGVCRGLADDGALLLDGADGLERLVSGSVEGFG